MDCLNAINSGAMEEVVLGRTIYTSFIFAWWC
jgi:hypothetical protein